MTNLLILSIERMMYKAACDMDTDTLELRISSYDVLCVMK